MIHIFFHNKSHLCIVNTRGPWTASPALIKEEGTGKKLTNMYYLRKKSKLVKASAKAQSVCAKFAKPELHEDVKKTVAIAYVRIIPRTL